MCTDITIGEEITLQTDSCLLKQIVNKTKWEYYVKSLKEVNIIFPVWAVNKNVIGIREDAHSQWNRIEKEWSKLQSIEKLI